MTARGVLLAIVGELASWEAAPYLVGVLLLLLFAYFWGRKAHGPRQRRFVHASLLLWCCVPLSILAGAMFHFSGSDELRGIAVVKPAAVFVVSLSVAAALGSVALLVIGAGARLNLAASSVGLLFAQFWAWLAAGCAIVGRCT